LNLELNPIRGIRKLPSHNNVATFIDRVSEYRTRSDSLNGKQNLRFKLTFELFRLSD